MSSNVTQGSKIQIVQPYLLSSEVIAYTLIEQDLIIGELALKVVEQIPPTCLSIDQWDLPPNYPQKIDIARLDLEVKEK